MGSGAGAQFETGRDQSWFEPLLVTKLLPPSASSTILDRPKVMAFLNAEPIPLLTLAHAPVGYGKTTAISLFFNELRKNKIYAAWLSIDEQNRDGKNFLAYLIASLAAAGLMLKDFQSAARSKLRQSREDVVRSALINHFAEVGEPIYIFLDEYEKIDGYPAGDIVSFMLTYAPKNIHFIIAARICPSLSLGILRGRGQIRELTVEHLRFSAAESLSYFGLDTLVAEKISSRCEGWPAALQMSRLWLEQNGTQAGCALSSRAGSDVAEFTDYLMEQVFSALTDDLRDVLLSICILERFDAELINALTGRADGWEIIGAIRARNLFINVIDRDLHWFSFHQIFRTFLVEVLHRRMPQEISVQHIRASRCFASGGHFTEAVAHACLSEDRAWMSELLSAHSGWFRCVHQGLDAYSPLPEWTASHPGEVPEADFITAYICVQTGKVARGRMIFDRVSAIVTDDVVGQEIVLSGRILDYLIAFYEDRVIDVCALNQLHAEIVGGIAAPIMLVPSQAHWPVTVPTIKGILKTVFD
ncbi:hypothetical protein D3Y57_02600 (plasmid) [Sphingomonas paeninsulae]|uniref:MalT-like winged helix domain-containing protein n=1 Tax=Sphingomonas paeninsulae TaxID=2319844 RepID=A0A494TGI3_SPHPE|nr:hypothetical protein D3Y57_02600 [Sphingomonas paeninsulae]